MKILDFFRRKPQENQNKTLELASMLNGYSNSFTAYSGDAYGNDIFRAAVDAIARNAAKMKAQHVVYNKYTGVREDGDQSLNNMLDTRPNDNMTAYDFIYKLTTHYFTNNNAFAVIDREGKNIKAIYPVKVSTMNFLTDDTGELFCSLWTPNGKKYILPYEDVIILRRFFNEKDLLGDDNGAIHNTLSLAHTQNEGMEHIIKSGANLKGLLKYNQVLAPEKLKEEKEKFVDDYMTISNTGGVAALDAKMDYIPLNEKPADISSAQLEAVKDKIYSYLGINENIIKSNYNENEWAAFYESTIEPLALQLSQELTNKIFSSREQAFGNYIRLDSNRMQFTSNETKTNIIKELMPYGIFTINQALEILNLPPVQDGDKRLQTLNVVDAAQAATYQGGTEQGRSNIENNKGNNYNNYEGAQQ